MPSTVVTRPSGTAPWHLVTLGRVALLDGSGTEIEELRGRSRKLALLVYLAVTKRSVPRAQLVEMFWGDRDEERARASLSEALSHLRRVLGRDALTAYATDVGLAPDLAITVDLLELDAAAKAGAHARALELYAGPFLDGLHIPGAGTFERWLERHRGRATDHFVSACAERYGALADADAHDEAARVAGRWLDVAWDCAEAADALISALAAPGTVDALQRAMAAYGRYCDRLATELEVDPDPALASHAAELERRLKAMTPTGTRAVRTTPVPSAPVVAVSDSTSPSMERDEADTPPSVMPTEAATERSTPPAVRDVIPAVQIATPPDLRALPVARRHRRSLMTLAGVAAVIVSIVVIGRGAQGASPNPSTESAALPLYRRAFARWESTDRDVDGARRLVDSALALDSTFSPAYVLRHRIARTAQRGAPVEDLRAAARHAAQLNAHDRLLVTGEVALADDNPVALAIADSLTAMYPNDSDALLLAARIASHTQAFERADTLAQRVIRLEGRAQWGTPHRRCLPCEATELRLSVAYAQGELARCDVLAGEYVERAGETPRALVWLAVLAQARGLWAAADSLYHRAAIPPDNDADARAVRMALLRGDSPAALRALQPWLSAPDPDRRSDGRFFQALALRDAGRAREGVRTLGGMERANFAEELGFGALLLDAGDARRAAAVFADASTRWVRSDAGGAASFHARITTWALAHQATALAAAGDTAALAPLADRMETLGQRALLGRVRTIHHWPRALLWQARGNRDSTIVALRRVLGSPVQSHLRAAWMLGRELLAADRPAEARDVIERALMGPVDASGYFVTRRELHTVLAEACTKLQDAACVALTQDRLKRTSSRELPTLARR